MDDEPAAPRQQVWRGGESDAYEFPQATPPTIFYMVASTPRSGSQLLCRYLWATGMLGAPAEYFNYQRTMLRMAARCSLPTCTTTCDA